MLKDGLALVKLENTFYMQLHRQLQSDFPLDGSYSPHQTDIPQSFGITGRYDELNESFLVCRSACIVFGREANVRINNSPRILQLNSQLDLYLAALHLRRVAWSVTLDFCV